MSKEPQLPELPSNNLITITTDNHVVETTRQDLEKVKSFCDDNKITLDYYMFEFMYYEDEPHDNLWIYRRGLFPRMG